MEAGRDLSHMYRCCLKESVALPPPPSPNSIIRDDSLPRVSFDVSIKKNLYLVHLGINRNGKDREEMREEWRLTKRRKGVNQKGRGS